MARQGLKVSRAEFEQNLLKKFDDAAFRKDILPLLRDGLNTTLMSRQTLCFTKW
jgi:hypothetical protein